MTPIVSYIFNHEEHQPNGKALTFCFMTLHKCPKKEVHLLLNFVFHRTFTCGRYQVPAPFWRPQLQLCTLYIPEYFGYLNLPSSSPAIPISFMPPTALRIPIWANSTNPTSLTCNLRKFAISRDLQKHTKWMQVCIHLRLMRLRKLKHGIVDTCFSSSKAKSSHQVLDHLSYKRANFECHLRRHLKTHTLFYHCWSNVQTKWRHQFSSKNSIAKASNCVPTTRVISSPNSTLPAGANFQNWTLSIIASFRKF